MHCFIIVALLYVMLVTCASESMPACPHINITFISRKQFH